MNNIVLDRLTSLALILLVFLYLFASFILLNPLIAISKYLIVGFVIIIFFNLLMIKHLTINKLKIFFPFILFQFVYIFNLTLEKDIIFTIFYQCFFMIITYVISNINWKIYQVRYLSSSALILCVILIFYIFSNSSAFNFNALGSYTYFLLFFPLIYYIGYKNKTGKLLIFIILLITITSIYFTNARSVFMAITFSVLTFILWKIITKRKLFFFAYFFLIFALIYSFIVIYPNLENFLPNFHYYEYLSLKYTGKSLLSGRGDIWLPVLGIIKDSLLLGHGLNISLEKAIGTKLSAHNLYILIALQTGLFGLTLFIIFLFSVWNTFWIARNNVKVIISACFFIGIIIHQTFEISLTQNNFGLGLIQWLIIGIGLSVSFNEIKNKKLA